MEVRIIYCIFEKAYGIDLYNNLDLPNYYINRFWAINEMLEITEDDNKKDKDLKFIKLIQEYGGYIGKANFPGKIYFKLKADAEKFKEFLESYIIMDKLTE